MLRGIPQQGALSFISSPSGMIFGGGTTLGKVSIPQVPDAGRCKTRLAVSKLRDTRVRPAAADLRLTGYSPHVTGQVIEPLPAVVTLTEARPFVVSPVLPGPGSITLTGATPTLRTDTAIGPTPATLTVTGASPVVVAPVVPSAPTLVITPAAPTVT